MLEQEFALIKRYINHYEKKNEKISKVSVGWHLDHSLKVLNSVYNALKKSDSKAYKSEFNALRIFIFILGFFPRGKAKAPQRVSPPEIISKEDIKIQLDVAVENFKSFKDINEHQYFEHPLFKQLKKKKAIKFLRLHTNHHLKIVKDILK